MDRYSTTIWILYHYAMPPKVIFIISYYTSLSLFLYLSHSISHSLLLILSSFFLSFFLLLSLYIFLFLYVSFSICLSIIFSIYLSLSYISFSLYLPSLPSLTQFLQVLCPKSLKTFEPKIQQIIVHK